MEGAVGRGTVWVPSPLSPVPRDCSLTPTVSWDIPGWMADCPLEPYLKGCERRQLIHAALRKMRRAVTVSLEPFACQASLLFPQVHILPQ